jgi:hypothetical protein
MIKRTKNETKNVALVPQQFIALGNWSWIDDGIMKLWLTKVRLSSLIT